MFRINRILAVSGIAIALAFCLAGCDDDVQYSSDNLPSESTADTGREYSQKHNHGETQGSGLHHQNEGRDIGAEQAAAIALAKVPGATAADVTVIERDHDHGRIEYEGELFYNGYEYEFEIDGATGNILKWEIDD